MLILWYLVKAFAGRKKMQGVLTFHALVSHRIKLSSAFPQTVWHANSLSGPNNSKV
jgi:hypothetical protein